jgi:hypothetical protein
VVLQCENQQPDGCCCIWMHCCAMGR